MPREMREQVSTSRFLEQCATISQQRCGGASDLCRWSRSAAGVRHETCGGRHEMKSLMLTRTGLLEKTPHTSALFLPCGGP